jgi:cyclophilin family peptidyl-prolyl cis-trans isomerase
MKKSIGTFLTIFIMCSLISNAQIISGQPELKFLIKTNMGDIKIKLYNDTPKHRDNFLKLVNEGWYNGSIFHRVINKFMIQGGWNKDGTEDPGYTIPAEITDDHFHVKGVVAAARMPDDINPEKASSSSQFYIVQGRSFTDAELDQIQNKTGHTFTAEQREIYKTTGGTPHLDGSYTIFGEVYEGLDVVDKIAAVKTGGGDKPIQNVVFSITQIIE